MKTLSADDIRATILAKKQVEEDLNRPALCEDCWKLIGQMLGISSLAAKSRCRNLGLGSLKPLPGQKSNNKGKETSPWNKQGGRFKSKKKVARPAS